jgi:demethylmenaquinone methyltransferase/2-methoxy-6-polyprenyl-1,4-benzoquinol methylase
MNQSVTNNQEDSDLPVGDEKRTAVKSMFDEIAPRYDMVNRIITFRMDVSWRKETVRLLDLQPNSLVLDLACGTGDFVMNLTRSGHRAIGVDLSLGMLKATQSDFPRIQGDLLDLPCLDESVDAAVCGFALRNLVDLEPFFSELGRTIKPGGAVGLLEVSKPDNKVLAWGHNIYFNKIVPRIGGVLSDRKAYSYLPKSVSYLPEPQDLMALLARCGFDEVTRKQLSGGIAQLFLARKLTTD